MSVPPYSATALRRGAWHFLSGKAVSGLLTFVIMLWLVRLLPMAEYGAYVSLIATTELAFALGGLGLPWAAVRYLPEARLRAGSAETRALALRLLAWQSILLGALAVLAGLTFDVLLPMLKLRVPAGAALAWAGLILAEGMGRFLRESLLGPLMQQADVRTSQVARQALLMTLLGMLAASHTVSLSAVLVAELVASLVAALVALSALWRYLHSLRGPAESLSWRAPAQCELLAIALPMYGGHLLALGYSPQVFLLLLQRYAGAEVTAAFGFLRSIYEQAARYLPATLLFSLLRPKLVASYVASGGMVELSRNANLAGKLSLFVLMPGVGFAFAGGEALIGLLSGGKFPNTGLLFFGLLLALVPFSQRQLLETVAVTAGQARLCTWGAASGLLMLPLMLWLLHAGAGVWAGVAALVAGHLLFALIIVAGLKPAGYRPDAAGWLILAAGAVAGAGAALLAPTLHQAWLELATQALAAALAFLIMAWLITPFSATERQQMNRLLGREVFHV